MRFKITLGETSAKLHPEADLYIDNYLATYGDFLRCELNLHGEILHDPDELTLAQRLDAISQSDVEVVTTLQGRYSLAIIGRVVNRLRDRGVNVVLTVEPIPEGIRELAGAPRIEYNRSLQVSAPKERQLRVFLCHTAADKQRVRDLYHRVREMGAEVWFDEESLLPGQDWNTEIQQALSESDLVIVCLSPRAINKAGYVQKEIRYALDCAEEQPEGAVYIVPVKLEECEVPSRLRQWQWVNLWEERCYDRLKQTLHARAFDLRLRANLEKNYERHRKAANALEKMRGHAEDLRKKIAWARNDDYRERVQTWLSEAEDKIRDMEESLQQIEGWIREDKEKLR